jgi:hypothetical protein
MESKNLDRLLESVDTELCPHGFRRHFRDKMTELGCVAFWRRLTWNSNRAVAVLTLQDANTEIGPFCQQMKWKLLWQTFSIPAIYNLGLQIIVCRDHANPPNTKYRIKGYVDKFDNQFVVLQSIFVVEFGDSDLLTAVATTPGVNVPMKNRYAATTTWGQWLTGRFQDSIAKAIAAAGYEPMPCE